MTSTATSPSTPRTDKQLDNANGDAAELPACAGFDLAAMRAVVDGIEQGKGSRPEIQPPPPSSVISAKRPQSASLPITKSPDLTQRSVTPNPTVSEVRPASAKPSLDDALLPSGSEEDERLPSSSPPTLSEFTFRSRPSGDLALSPGAYDGGASWTPVSADKEGFGSTPFGNPFHSTPFAVVGQTGGPTPSNVSIPAVPGVERDPWSYSGDVSNNMGAKKPSSVFATNPWES